MSAFIKDLNKSVNEQRKAYGLPPIPLRPATPAPIQYRSTGIRVKTVSEMRLILSTKCLSSDLIRLESVARKFIRSLPLRQYVRKIKRYLQ